MTPSDRSTHFLNLNGKIVLKIYMPRQRESEYIDFVNALSERIKMQTPGRRGGIR